MKNLLSVVLLMLFLMQGIAQNRQQNICIQSFDISEHTPDAPASQVDDANDIINKIIRAIGLKANFEVRAANIPNAAAVVYNQKRYVLYNPDFISSLVRTAGNEWAAVSVLAHEIGHHLNGHTLENHGSRPDQELEADEFSGFVLRRMGASLQEAQVAMKIAANARATATHPAQYDRLAAIERGWTNANDQSLGRTGIVANKSAKAPEVITPKQNTQPLLSDKYIAADVHFNADEQGLYYVTTKLNLVKVQDNQLYLIGKLSPLENKQYPFLIHDEKQTRLLVDNQGSILNAKGDKIGYMDVHPAD